MGFDDVESFLDRAGKDAESLRYIWLLIAALCGCLYYLLDYLLGKLKVKNMWVLIFYSLLLIALVAISADFWIARTGRYNPITPQQATPSLNALAKSAAPIQSTNPYDVPKKLCIIDSFKDIIDQNFNDNLKELESLADKDTWYSALKWPDNSGLQRGQVPLNKEQIDKLGSDNRAKYAQRLTSAIEINKENAKKLLILQNKYNYFSDITDLLTPDYNQQQLNNNYYNLLMTITNLEKPAPSSSVVLIGDGPIKEFRNSVDNFSSWLRRTRSNLLALRRKIEVLPTAGAESPVCSKEDFNKVAK